MLGTNGRKGTRGAWRAGFWDQRSNRPPSPNPKWRSGSLLHRAYLTGYQQAADNPGQFVPECWDQSKLIEFAIAAALSATKNLGEPRPGEDPRINEARAIREGWQELKEKQIWLRLKK